MMKRRQANTVRAMIEAFIDARRIFRYGVIAPSVFIFLIMVINDAARG